MTEDNQLPNQIVSDLFGGIFTYLPKKGRGFRLDKRMKFTPDIHFAATL